MIRGCQVENTEDVFPARLYVCRLRIDHLGYTSYHHISDSWWSREKSKINKPLIQIYEGILCQQKARFCGKYASHCKNQFWKDFSQNCELIFAVEKDPLMQWKQRGNAYIWAWIFFFTLSNTGTVEKLLNSRIFLTWSGVGYRGTFLASLLIKSIESMGKFLCGIFWHNPAEWHIHSIK